MVRKKQTPLERWLAAKPIQEEKTTESTEARNRPQYKFPTAERFRLTPRTEQEIEMLAHDLLLYAQQEDSMSFEGFILISGLPNTRLYEYARRHQGLSEAIVFARQVIGQRRERGALENRLNGGVHISTYPLYNPEYRAWKKEMSQKDNMGESIKIVVMDKYPEVDTVPVKEEDNDRQANPVTGRSERTQAEDV